MLDFGFCLSFLVIVARFWACFNFHFDEHIAD